METGTRLCRAESSRTSSRLGRTPSFSSFSAATPTQHLLRVGEAQPARAEQHGEVVEHVGGLLGDPLVGLLPRGTGDLLGLLLHLLADERRGRQRQGGGGAPPPA